MGDLLLRGAIMRENEPSLVFSPRVSPGPPQLCTAYYTSVLRSSCDMFLQGLVADRGVSIYTVLQCCCSLSQTTEIRALLQDYYNYTVQPALRKTLVDIAGDAGWKQGTTRDCGQDCCLMSAPLAICIGHK